MSFFFFSVTIIQLFCFHRLTRQWLQWRLLASAGFSGFGGCGFGVCGSGIPRHSITWPPRLCCEMFSPATHRQTIAESCSKSTEHGALLVMLGVLLAVLLDSVMGVFSKMPLSFSMLASKKRTERKPPKQILQFGSLLASTPYMRSCWQMGGKELASFISKFRHLVCAA